MPSSKQRHRIEIHEDVYQRLNELATREGYPASRFADKLLNLAMAEYTQARQQHRYPLEGMLGTLLRGFGR